MVSIPPWASAATKRNGEYAERSSALARSRASRVDGALATNGIIPPLEIPPLETLPRGTFGRLTLSKLSATPLLVPAIHVPPPMRSGTTSDTPTLTVQPYLTGTTYSADNLSTALTTMQTIYSQNGITLTVHTASYPFVLPDA